MVRTTSARHPNTYTMGSGYLVKNVWTIKKNAYGYAGITVPEIAAATGDLTVIVDKDTPSIEKKDKLTPDELASIVTVNTLNNIMVVTKNYVLDYTSALKDVIMETETGGFTYRYVYGLQKLSVSVSPVAGGGGGISQNGKVKMWYHMDRLGSTDYLSDNVQGKVASFIDYDEWGVPQKKMILKLGQRELDLVVEYTRHPYDQVLGLYFAEARMYDAADKRFVSVDPVKGFI